MCTFTLLYINGLKEECQPSNELKLLFSPLYILLKTTFQFRNDLSERHMVSSTESTSGERNKRSLSAQALACIILVGDHHREGEGAVAPTCRQGRQTVSNAPPPRFRRLSGVMPANVEKTGIYRSKCEILPKRVKLACNYFKNSSALSPRSPTGAPPLDPSGELSSPRPPVVLPPSQTSFCLLW